MLIGIISEKQSCLFKSDCSYGSSSKSGSKYSGKNITMNSGYTGLLQDGAMLMGKSFLKEKYYNFYEGDNLSTICNDKSCISHALNETEKWYSDATRMVAIQYPWYT